MIYKFLSKFRFIFIPSSNFTADGGRVTLLGLLDQSAAFDCVDHRILCDRLRHNFGLTGNTLNWICSYLSDRSQFVHYNGKYSKTRKILYGVPQGSVLGPLFFLLYTVDLFKIVDKHGLNSHGYADDLQIFGHAETEQAETLILRFSNCVDELKSWMASSRLRLNPMKTELIWLGSSRRLQSCPMEPQLIAGVLIKPVTMVRDLGVYLDSDLSLRSHIANITKICFFHIRQLRLVRRSLTLETAEALMRSFIHSRLDYCNGILAGQPDYVYKRLQSVLRSAARLVLLLPCHASVTSLMRDKLHWLGFPYRVDFKLCLLAHKSLNGRAPQYLARHCIPVNTVIGRSQLRSASSGQLVVPSIRTKTFGTQGFSFSCPSAWNKLPSELRNQNVALSTFRTKLKTYFFKL